MLEDITRRSDRYSTTGLTTMSFGFVVWKTSDIAVQLSEDDSSTASTLVENTDYTVALNSDQTATPGGIVTLTNALTDGQVAVIISTVPYTQEVQLTNYSRFPPTIINTGMDRLEAQIQQLKEVSDRHLVVPATSSKTTEEVMTDLLETAENAAAYATQAAETLAAAQEVKADIDSEYTEIEADTATVKTLADQVNEQTSTVIGMKDDIDKVIEIQDDLVEVADHADEVHAVGQDLLGLSVDSVDLGLVSEDADPINDTDSSLIGQILDHIDDVTSVGSNIESVTTDATNIQSIRLVAADLGAEIDYTFLHDFGEWNVDDTIQELDDSGRISKVANKISAVQNVSDNMESVTSAVTAASEAKQAASSALAAEARIQALEDQINEIVSTNYTAVAEES